MRLGFKKIFEGIARLLTQEEKRLLDKILHQQMADGVLYPEHLHYFYWESQIDSWDAMPSPVRPSKEEMRIYAQLLEDKETGSALVLGSTPELRDLLAKRPATKVYLADFSYRMPLAMLRFTERVDPTREIWVKANWFELPFPDQFFDVILGDLILQQFSPDLEDAFLQKASLLLRPGGYFIARFHFLDPQMRKKNIAEVIRKILASRCGPGEKVILLKLQILWLYADPEKRLLNREISAREFEKFVKTSGTNDAIVRRALASLCADKDSFRTWSPPTEEELARILSTYFNVLDKKIANDYGEALYYPIYVLRPKRNT